MPESFYYRCTASNVVAAIVIINGGYRRKLSGPNSAYQDLLKCHLSLLCPDCDDVSSTPFLTIDESVALSCSQAFQKTLALEPQNFVFNIC